MRDGRQREGRVLEEQEEQEEEKIEIFLHLAGYLLI